MPYNYQLYAIANSQIPVEILGDSDFTPSNARGAENGGIAVSPDGKLYVTTFNSADPQFDGRLLGLRVRFDGAVYVTQSTPSFVFYNSGIPMSEDGELYIDNGPVTHHYRGFGYTSGGALATDQVI